MFLFLVQKSPCLRKFLQSRGKSLPMSLHLLAVASQLSTVRSPLSMLQIEREVSSLREVCSEVCRKPDDR